MNVEIAKREVVVSATFRFDVANQPTAGLVIDQLKNDFAVTTELSRRAWEHLIYTAHASSPPLDISSSVDTHVTHTVAHINALLAPLQIMPTIIQVYGRLVEYPKAPDSSPEAQHG